MKSRPAEAAARIPSRSPAWPAAPLLRRRQVRPCRLRVPAPLRPAAHLPRRLGERLRPYPRIQPPLPIQLQLPSRLPSRLALLIQPPIPLLVPIPLQGQLLPPPLPPLLTRTHPHLQPQALLSLRACWWDTSHGRERRPSRMLASNSL